MGSGLGLRAPTRTAAATASGIAPHFFFTGRYGFSFPTSKTPQRLSNMRGLCKPRGTDLLPDIAIERSESDVLVDGVDFGELCNEFECISSPAVESTARQLARDIMELREGNRALGSFSISVKYKDPVRSFTGREKYKGPLWVRDAIENPIVSVQEMTMLSTSVLNIKWTVRGKAKFFIFADLVVCVNSLFTLNQISGQVVEHEETWDVSLSSPLSQGYFWISRRSFSLTQSVKDAVDKVKNTVRSSMEQESQDIYPDPTGDPTKFFQRDESLQRDAYQIALFLSIVYVVVQFLRSTL